MSNQDPKVSVEFFPAGPSGKPEKIPVSIKPKVIFNPGKNTRLETEGKPTGASVHRQVTPEGIVITRTKETFPIANTRRSFSIPLPVLPFASPVPPKRDVAPIFSRPAQTDDTCVVHFEAKSEQETIESSGPTSVPCRPIFLPTSMQQLPQVSERLTEATGNLKVHQPPPVIELPTALYGPDAQRAIVSLENEYDIRFPPPPPRRDVSLRAIGCGSTMDDDDGFGNAEVVAQTTIILNESTPGNPGNIIVRRGNSITNLAEIPLQDSSTVQQYQVQPDAATISPQPSTTVNVTTRIRDLTSQVMRESENVNRATQRLRRQRPAPPLNRVYSAESKLWNLMSLENQLANEIANYRASGRVRDPEFLNALTQTEEKLRRLMSAENSAAQDIRRIKKESFKQETYKVMTPRNRYSPESSISTSMSSYTPPKSPSVSQPMVMMPQPQMMPLMQMAGGPQGGFMASPMYPGMLRVTIDSPECTCSTSSSAVSSSESLPKRKTPREETKIVVEIPKTPAVPPPPPPPPPPVPEPPPPPPAESTSSSSSSKGGGKKKKKGKKGKKVIKAQKGKKGKKGKKLKKKKA